MERFSKYTKHFKAFNKTASPFHSSISSHGNDKAILCGISLVLVVIAIVFLCPPMFTDDDPSNALTGTSVASDTTLSISLSGSVLPLDLTPTSSSGTFATTVDGDTHATIRVATNNITGYTLGIKAVNSNSDTADKLVSNIEQCENTPTSTKCSLSSLSQPVSSAEYLDNTVEGIDLNNTWGYAPSYYNSTPNTTTTTTLDPNTNEDITTTSPINYYPAPVNGDTIATTDAPNQENTTANDGTLVEDEYTIDYGIRIDYTPYTGTYSTNYNNQSYIITAVGNPVPYSVSYDANKPQQAPAEAEVDNMPTAQTGSVTSGDTVAVILNTKVPTLGSNNPTTGEYEYAGYVFNGWCTVQPEVPAEINGQTNTLGYQVCPQDANTFQPGDNFGIDQTVENTQILYATWGAPARVTYNSNGLIYNKTPGDITNTVEYIPTYEGNKITGQRQNMVYTGTYNTPAYEETTPVTNYIMKGWSTDQYATEATYTDEQAIINDLTLNADNNITLYAIWTYTTVITFDGNGADSGMMEPFVIEAGKTEALLQSTFTKTGYYFAGWNTEPDSSGVEYAVQGSFTASPISSDVTLYAQWVPINLTFVAGEHIDTLIVADNNGTIYTGNNGWMPYYASSVDADNSIVFTAPTEGEKYIITVVPEAGYKLSSNNEHSSWKIDYDSGTLASSTLLTTTYVVGSTGNILTVSAEPITETNKYPTMQDIAVTECPDYTSAATGINVTDIRDSKSYTIAKFGNYCYMLSNIRLDGGTTLDTMTSDASANTFALPDQTIWTDESQNHHCEARMKYINGEYYYNWYAATANPTTGYANYACPRNDTLDGASLGSICPAGWTLPAYNNMREMMNLLWDNGANPGSFSSTGYYDGMRRGNGYWWSKTPFSYGIYAASFEYVTSSDRLFIYDYKNLHHGSSVRCILSV